MRVTVTGASGHVGVNLVEALLADGFSVVAADRERSSEFDRLGVEFTEIDVLDPDSLDAAFKGADAVIHLAAVVSIVGDPTGHVWKVNVQGPRNAAHAALRQGVGRFVHCSSVHAYDLETCGPSLDESGPRVTGRDRPVYDLSKDAGEAAVREVIGEGLNGVIVNPTGVIGPNDHGPSRMGEILLQLRDGKIPVNVGGGFDFVDVRDLVLGMISAMRQGRTGENYLLSGTRISLKQLAQIIGRLTGRHAPRLDVPAGLVSPLAPLVMRLTPADRTPLLTPDAMHALVYSPIVSHYKATRELGYAARPIHVTVEDTLEWFDRHRVPVPG